MGWWNDLMTRKFMADMAAKGEAGTDATSSFDSVLGGGSHGGTRDMGGWKRRPEVGGGIGPFAGLPSMAAMAAMGGGQTPDQPAYGASDPGNFTRGMEYAASNSPPALPVPGNLRNTLDIQPQGGGAYAGGPQVPFVGDLPAGNPFIKAFQGAYGGGAGGGGQPMPSSFTQTIRNGADYSSNQFGAGGQLMPGTEKQYVGGDLQSPEQMRATMEHATRLKNIQDMMQVLTPGYKAEMMTTLGPDYPGNEDARRHNAQVMGMRGHLARAAMESEGARDRQLAEFQQNREMQRNLFGQQDKTKSEDWRQTMSPEVALRNLVMKKYESTGVMPSDHDINKWAGDIAKMHTKEDALIRGKPDVVASKPDVGKGADKPDEMLDEEVQKKLAHAFGTITPAKEGLPSTFATSPVNAENLSSAILDPNMDLAQAARVIKSKFPHGGTGSSDAFLRSLHQELIRTALESQLKNKREGTARVGDWKMSATADPADFLGFTNPLRTSSVMNYSVGHPEFGTVGYKPTVMSNPFRDFGLTYKPDTVSNYASRADRMSKLMAELYKAGAFK